MKSERMTIGLVVLLLAVPAYSDVNILWEQYHCSGRGEYPDDHYYITDTSPVDGISDDWSARSSAWKFGASAETGASWGEASASSTFIFTVDQPELAIKLVGSLWSRAFPDIWGGISYTLTDDVTKETIGSQSWSLSYDDDIIGAWGRTIEKTITCNLIIGHEYKLSLSANVTNADGTDASLNAVLIPEPASLLLVGFGGLALWRKVRR